MKKKRTQKIPPPLGNFTTKYNEYFFLEFTKGEINIGDEIIDACALII